MLRIVKLKMDNLQAVKEQLADVELERGADEPAEPCAPGGADEPAEPSGPGGVYQPAEPRLLSMPVEIILKICSFLDADFLKNTFTKVCRRFETILADSHIWRYWVHSKLDGAHYPPLPALAAWAARPVDWPGVAAHMARERRTWRDAARTRRHVVVKDVHIASVDTVLLVDNGALCVSGGRDRGMVLWSVRDVAGGAGDAHAPAPRTLRTDAHEGWVWDLAADSVRDTTVVYSASWDNTVKAWDLRTGLTRLETFRCGMSALSVAACGDVVLAGLYSQRVVTFDRRAGPRPVASYKPHRGPVLALAVRDNKVASVSEDRTLCVWDAAAGRALARGVALGGAGHPACVSWSRAALYVGDSRGTLHLLHPAELRVVRARPVWPEPACKVAACVQARGGLVLCSDKGEIQFLYNSWPPRQFAVVRSATRDVTQLRYSNDVLVIGTCDSALEFWLPADRCAGAD